jgi:S1-C subfamily serine protease
MKKTLLFLFIIMLFLLSSCTIGLDYDEIYQDYEEHLQENQEVYLERINFLNHISENIVRGVVKVKRLSSNQSSVALGSGIVFYDDALYYYILTNNHVVYDEDVSESTYTVYDYQNNTYPATYMVGDRNYDLAVIRIRKRLSRVLAIPFAADNLEINSDVTTIGYPESQSNSINTGMLLDYGDVTIDLPSTVIDIDFEVMIADLPLKSGSSGSGAINNNFELIGIVFAGNFTGGSNIADYSFIIPISEVKEFLALHEFSYREAKS